MPIVNRIADLQDEMVAWRRDFHENPELGFEVHRTAEIVAGRLRAFGCDEVVEGIGRTGVVGVIRGREPGPCIGLRADMDALPIVEATGADWASKAPGMMHACGHDGHMAMLLGAGKYLAETRNFAGSVALIFQPAEEDGGGGEKMVEDGLMERFAVERVWGMHNAPDLPVGAFAIRSGPSLASTDEFDITITGRGGHAARPHSTVDPTVIAAQIVIAAQSVVSRTLDPVEMMVVSITAMTTGEDTYNVIPQTCALRGTVRCFRNEDRAMARDRLKTLSEEIAAAAGGAADFVWHESYPPMVNHPEETEIAAQVADEIMGADCPRAVPPQLGAEDFAYMLEARPGAMIMIGNGPTEECHHPAYDFADDTMPAGASFWVRLTERALPLGGR